MPILLAAYLLRPLYMFIEILPHVGDGEFQNVSRRHGPLVLNCYLHHRSDCYRLERQLPGGNCTH